MTERIPEPGGDTWRHRKLSWTRMAGEVKWTAWQVDRTSQSCYDTAQPENSEKVLLGARSDN